MAGFGDLPLSADLIPSLKICVLLEVAPLLAEKINKIEAQLSENSVRCQGVAYLI
jgi:hypothetical protein